MVEWLRQRIRDWLLRPEDHGSHLSFHERIVGMISYRDRVLVALADGVYEVEMKGSEWHWRRLKLEEAPPDDPPTATDPASWRSGEAIS